MSVDAAQLKEIIHEALNERDRIDADTHAHHHAWIEQQQRHEAERLATELEERRSRKARWEKVKTTVIGTVISAIVLGLLALLYNVGAFVIALYEQSKRLH